MHTVGSLASVVAAIHEDAAAECERIREALAAELASIAEERDAAEVTIADREARIAAARRENEERIARQEWEGRRASIEQREAWLQRVAEIAQERFAREEAADGTRAEALVREARARLPAGAHEVTRNGRGGCVVTVGNVAYDNTFDARVRRLESEWRGVLAELYRP
jgi:vacuolar-type H+-ATPase subunit E/Vma4